MRGSVRGLLTTIHNIKPTSVESEFAIITPPFIELFSSCKEIGSPDNHPQWQIRVTRAYIPDIHTSRSTILCWRYIFTGVYLRNDPKNVSAFNGI